MVAAERFFKCQIFSPENVFFNYSRSECCPNNSLASKKDSRPIRKMKIEIAQILSRCKKLFLYERNLI